MVILEIDPLYLVTLKQSLPSVESAWNSLTKYALDIKMTNCFQTFTCFQFQLAPLHAGAATTAAAAGTAASAAATG